MCASQKCKIFKITKLLVSRTILIETRSRLRKHSKYQQEGRYFSGPSTIRMTTIPPKEEKVDHAFYEELQAQLKEALNAKKAADKALSGVEDKIEKFEGSDESSHF